MVRVGFAASPACRNRQQAISKYSNIIIFFTVSLIFVPQRINVQFTVHFNLSGQSNVHIAQYSLTKEEYHVIVSFHG